MKKNNIDKDFDRCETISDTIVDIMNGVKADSTTEFGEWMASDESSFDTLKKLTNEKWLDGQIKNFANKDKELRFTELRKRKERIARKRFMLGVSSVAAAMVFVSMLVYYVKNNTKPEEIITQEYSNIISTNLAPTLITSYGKEISVGSAQDVIDIVSLAHVNESDSIIQNTSEQRFNRFVNPAKHSTSIKLEDNTTIHLNGQSEIIFPEHFTDSVRRVELIGEAYFEVAKSSAKFVVKAGDANITVYGTKFNVNTNNKDIVQTVLVEGKVGVALDGRELHMNPNELCEVDITNGEITKKHVDVTKYIAWTTGMFMFEKDTFETLLAQLSSWYGLEFKLENEKLKDVAITVLFSKDASIEEVMNTLSMLELNINFIKTERGYVIR